MLVFRLGVGVGLGVGVVGVGVGLGLGLREREGRWCSLVVLNEKINKEGSG